MMNSLKALFKPESWSCQMNRCENDRKCMNISDIHVISFYTICPTLL